MDAQLIFWVLACASVGSVALYWDHSLYRSIRKTYVTTVVLAASATALLPCLLRYKSPRLVAVDILVGSLSMCVLALSNLNSQNPALLPKTSKEAEFLEDEKNDRWERLLDNPHKQERERANSEFGRYGRKSRNVSLLIFFALVTVITVPMLFTDH